MGPFVGGCAGCGGNRPNTSSTGCDDVTYANECAAVAAHVGVAGFGTCDGDCLDQGVVIPNGERTETNLQCERCTCRDGMVECVIIEPNTCI
jgi:hypothetical protein